MTSPADSCPDPHSSRTTIVGPIWPCFQKWTSDLGVSSGGSVDRHVCDVVMRVNQAKGKALGWSYPGSGRGRLDPDEEERGDTAIGMEVGTAHAIEDLMTYPQIPVALT